MKQRSLGKSGLQVSVVGLGCNNFGGRTDLEASRSVIHKALDLGITLFDTADVYPVHGGDPGSSEKILGQGLGNRRKDIVLATKFGMRMDPAGFLRGASRRYILAAVEASLTRLGTDWIDLYQLHTPDSLTPIEETLRALEDLVREGKIRYFGCSNLAAWQVVEAQWTAKTLGINRIVSCQYEYSLLARDAERELLPVMQAYGIGLLPYFPLASGLLSGKYRKDNLPAGARLTESRVLSERYLTTANWRIVEHLEAFCAKREWSLLELAFGWLAASPAVASVIAGATRPSQVEQNVKAVSTMLAPDDLAEIDRLTARN
jgi:aryl-alcohol dehydrogenase-like predicted oxidoreductase